MCFFGVDEMMSDLELKLFSELSPGKTIICCRFKFPNKRPLAIIGGGIGKMAAQAFSLWVFSKKIVETHKKPLAVDNLKGVAQPYLFLWATHLNYTFLKKNSNLKFWKYRGHHP